MEKEKKEIKETKGSEKVSQIVEVTSALPKKHEVTLKQDHVDNGIQYKAGQKIVVDDSTLAFLIKHNIVDVKVRN